MKHMRKLLLGLAIVLLLGLVPAGSLQTMQTAQAASASVYRARAKKVKKNLPKKVKKLLKRYYSGPSCRLTGSRRRGSKMTCYLQGAIGWDGAYMITCVVNLKNGKVTVTDNMVDIPYRFKVSMK